MKEKRRNRKTGLVIVIGLFLLLIGLFVFSGVEKRVLDQAARNEAGGSFAQLEQGSVNYFLEGPADAPVVVLVHGFSVPAYVWEPTAAYLNENGYRTLRFDLFGRGYSDRPDLVYDISLFTDQITGLVDKLNLEKPLFVVGLSMGGPIAARYAYQHPDDIYGVVLISPEVTQTTNQDILPLNMPYVGEYLMAAVMEPYVLPKLQTGDFMQPENFPDWEVNYREQLQFKGTGRALLSTIRELVNLNPEDEYKALNDSGLPVMLIWGTADQTIGHNQIEILQQILPELETRFVKDAGHLVHYEMPDDVNPELIDFLNRISR